MADFVSASASTVARKAPRRFRRRRWLVVAGIIVVLAVAGGLSIWSERDLGDPVVGATQIAVRDNEFSPQSVEVPVGTTITWTWEGNTAHNVVGDGFESDEQQSGTFTHTFGEPGTHEYECTLHFLMRGEVVVRE